jgi:hypothetical protein
MMIVIGVIEETGLFQWMAGSRRRIRQTTRRLDKTTLMVPAVLSHGDLIRRLTHQLCQD